MRVQVSKPLDSQGKRQAYINRSVPLVDKKALEGVLIREVVSTQNGFAVAGLTGVLVGGYILLVTK